jgi:5-histidylcysteine sulfoxide synthase/putative 4-mercaptohistidine N1-methyltranferase
MQDILSSMSPEHQKLRLTRTINLELGDAESKRQEILDYFHNTFTIYEELFKIISNHRSFYKKAEPLRHPLVFYFGHTATFFLNKLMLAGLIQERVNPKFESMFAVGVDEMDWDDLNESHYDWPSITELIDYRNQIRSIIDKLIKELPMCLPINWSSPFWIIMMGIEHERIHLETSAVIMRRLNIDEVQDNALFPICPDAKYSGYNDEGEPRVTRDGEFPVNELLSVEAGEVRLGKKKPLYGWDNEYGTHNDYIQAFAASKFLVSNYEYLKFMEDGGYDKEEYWTEEGWRWNRSTKMTRPLFWIPDDVVNGKQTYKFRALTSIIDMPWDWPVETNYLESKAFCNWKAEKTGKPIRLPTEDEWYRLRDMIPVDLDTWEFGTVGNVNMEGYASSMPVNKFETNGFYDIVGNVWQHTETPIDGFDGFKIHPLYDDFSTPTFDTMHNMIKGGSWISTGNEAIYESRYAFRRHFYQFAGFRYVEATAPVIIKNQKYEMDTEVTKYLEAHYASKKYFGVENFSKKCIDKVMQVCKEYNIPLNKAIDLGCAVGRSTFELAKGGFKEATGLDLSARFFQMAVKLKDFGKVRYGICEEGEIVEFKEVELQTFDFDGVKNQVSFYQQDASNLDFKKFNSYDLVFAGNLICRMKYPKRLLSSIHNLVKPGGLLILTSTTAWSTDYTDKDQWIGGYKKDGENYSTHIALKEILAEEFKEIKKPEEIEYVMKETRRQFSHGFSQIYFFQRKE